MSGDLEELLKRTRAQVARERGLPAALRALSTPWRLVIGALGVLLAVLLPAWAMQNPHSPGLTPVRIAALVAFGVSATLLLEGALHPLHRRPWPVTAVRAVLILVIGVILAVLACLAASALEPPLHEAVACFTQGVVVGSASLLLVGTLERDGIHSPARVALAAALSCVAGLAFLVLHCAQTAPFHLLLGHGTVLLAALGAYVLLAGRRAVQ